MKDSLNKTSVITDEMCTNELLVIVKELWLRIGNYKRPYFD